jgi:DNA-binding beta-propeller fold protein YncE
LRPSPRLTVAIIVVLGIGAGLLGWRLLAPSPTSFGWPAGLTTVAGGGERGLADGAGAAARFSDPFGLAVDAKGTVYVADAGEAGRIRKIDRNGRTTTLPGAFDTPSGLAVDAKGALYVADTSANLIRKIGPGGAVTTLAGDGTAGFRDGAAGQAQFNGPIGVAVDKAGAVYVADAYNDRIRLITPDGEVKTLAGGPAPGFADGKGEAAAFHTPCGLALDAAGALLIADAGNDAVRRLAPDGAVTTLARFASDSAAQALREPMALAATRDGYVYIATFGQGRILQLSPKGELRVLTGRNAFVPQNQSLVLSHPAGLALDRDGGLYVAEAGGYAIRRLNRSGKGLSGPAAEPAAPAPALMRTATVPWPLDPQTNWHEVVGGAGEVRGNRQGDSRDHLHAGLDVHAEVGQTVLAIADGKVADPLAAFGPNTLSEGLQLDELTYIHMRVGRTSAGAPLDEGRFRFIRDAAGKVAFVRVKRGTRFHVGEPLGTVNAMAHVHLELSARGRVVNPIGLRFPGLTDHFAPRIQGVQLRDAAGLPLGDRQNGRLVVSRGAGALSLVVDAWDQVDGDQPGRRLGLYRLGYQILKADGSPVTGFEQPLITMVFDVLPADRAAAKIAYAPESGETVHGARETRFLYVVTNIVRGGRAETGSWNPAGLAPGDYIIRIDAADYAGNTATENRDLPISVR